ncbi:four helix bundle protein [Bacteroides sp. 519]|uniref:four helix bundle protein n=1 Tax=Bacteroides sp. 519 TaxID=2302937 RepID=UPI0019402841|nr:four helix bundle protein [Bacteroides sp. 519]
MEIRTHKDLLVWQKSIDLVCAVYSLLKQYPKEELFAMSNQIRRCVVSIPANIAEGCGRRSKAELSQFLHIALGSASELETFFIISKRLNYITDQEYNDLNSSLLEIIKMISGLVRNLQATRNL